MSKKFNDSFPRFIPKVPKTSEPGKFEVYDRENGSYPKLLGGFGEVKGPGTEAEMEIEVARLTEYYKSRGLY